MESGFVYSLNFDRFCIENDWNVRFGSLADICSAKGHVRFAPNSDINCVLRKSYNARAALVIRSATFAGVWIKQVLGTVALAKRGLLPEPKSRIAVFNRGLAILVAEAGCRP
jgi:hypothetical protein